MATGTKSDFKIYHPQLNAGLIETLVQNTAIFNAASRNTLRIVVNMLEGDYKYERFFQNIANLVSRRDTTSTSDATALKLTQDELISVKLNRLIGPIEQTLDAFKKIGARADAGALSFLLGTQIAKSIQVDYTNTMLTALVAALGTQSTLLYTEPTNGTLATDTLVNGLSKMGDAADRVIMWVMHSKPYRDLVAEQISANITGVANFAVATAQPITLNRPVLVTDDSALVVDNGSNPDDYYTLGLVQNAAVAEDSEDRTIVSELVTGKNNILVRLQGETAYNLGVRGFKWDVTNGGENPDASTVGTGTNWDKVMGDVKDLCGVRIQTR